MSSKVERPAENLRTVSQTNRVVRSAIGGAVRA
jgi:hypothetical protein